MHQLKYSYWSHFMHYNYNHHSITSPHRHSCPNQLVLHPSRTSFYPLLQHLSFSTSSPAPPPAYPSAFSSAPPLPLPLPLPLRRWRSYDTSSSEKKIEEQRKPERKREKEENRERALRLLNELDSKLTDLVY